MKNITTKLEFFETKARDPRAGLIEEILIELAKTNSWPFVNTKMSSKQIKQMMGVKLARLKTPALRDFFQDCKRCHLERPHVPLGKIFWGKLKTK